MIAEDAFSDNPQRHFFHATEPATTVLVQLEEGLAHDLPLLVVSGVAGVGKTMVVREVLARAGEHLHTAWLELPGGAPDALLPTAIWMFGDESPPDEPRPDQVARLGHALAAIAARGKTPVLVVDNAHTLAPEMLAELGRIESAASASQHMLKLVLMGELALDARLAEPAYQSFAARAAVRAYLRPLTLFEVRTYLDTRVAAAGGDGARVFSRKAVRELHARTAGVPALVNAVAQAAITAARLAGLEMVNPEHVRAVRVTVPELPRVAPHAPAVKPVVAVETRAANATALQTPAAASESPEISEQATPASAASEAAGSHGTAPQTVAELGATEAAPNATTEPTDPPEPAVEPLSVNDMDSTNPRVRDWVSRFTDSHRPVRFGGLPPVQPHLVEFEAPAVIEPPRKREPVAKPPLARAPVAPARVAPAPVAPPRVAEPQLVSSSASSDPALAPAPPDGPFVASLRANMATRSPRHGGALGAVVPIVLMVGMAVVAIIASTRGGFDKRGRDDSAHTTAAPSEQPPVATQPVAPPPVPEVVRDAAAEDAANARFCLSVGSYLFEDRARIQCRSLTRRTGHKAWVEPSRSGGSLSFRILLGGFATEADAERAADRMLSRGIVTEALVEPLSAEKTQR